MDPLATVFQTKGYFFVICLSHELWGPMIPRIVFFEVKKGIESCISSCVQPLWKGRDENNWKYVMCILQVFHLYLLWMVFFVKQLLLKLYI